MLIGEKHDLKRSWDGKSYILSPSLADRSRCCCCCWCRVHLCQAGKEGEDFLLPRLLSLLRERERRERGLCCPLRTCWECVMYIRRLWAAAEKKKYLNHKSISARLDFNGSNAIPMIFSDTHRVETLYGSGSFDWSGPGTVAVAVAGTSQHREKQV